MEWATITKAFLEVGMLGLCAVSMITMYIRDNKRNHIKDDEKDKRIDKKDERNEERTDLLLEAMKTQNEKYHDELAEQLRMVTSTIINEVVNHVPSDDENAKITKVSQEIDECLQEILEETKADRASLVQYHNGGKGINKQSFLKMSMTNEQTKQNVKPVIVEFKDQFRNVLSYFVKEIGDKGYCYIQDVDSIASVDNGMYEFLKARGVEAKFGVAVRNANNFVIGFICLEFGNKQTADINKIKKSFEGKQKAIEALLNL